MLVVREKRVELWILLLMCVIYFFSYFHRVAIPGTLFDELQYDFSASAVAIAALGSIFLYIYASVQIFVGILADRFGGVLVLVAGALLLSVGSILFPLSHTLSLLYVTRALVALGASLIFISIVKEIDILFESRHFAILLGISVFLGYSGGLVGTYPLERAAARFGWRPALLAIGVLCTLALVAVIWLLKKTGYIRERRTVKSSLHLGDIFRNIHSLPLMISGSINFAVYFLFQATIGKKILTDCCGLTSAGAASVTFLMMLIVMGVTSVSGIASRFIGNRRKPILIGATTLTLIATGLMSVNLLAAPDAHWLSAGMVLLSISVGSCILFISSMKELNPADAAGTSVGVLNGSAYLVVAVTTHLAGFTMDLFKDQVVHTASAVIYPSRSYACILLGCLAMAVVSFIASLFIRESRGVCVYTCRNC